MGGLGLQVTKAHTHTHIEMCLGVSTKLGGEGMVPYVRETELSAACNVLVLFGTVGPASILDIRPRKIRPKKIKGTLSDNPCVDLMLRTDRNIMYVIKFANRKIW